MSRPRIKIKLEYADFIYESLAVTGLIALVLLPAYYSNQLPDLIPSHFNWYGEPDAYSNKLFIWLLPVIGLIMYLLLTITAKYPHTFNYTTKITEENAKKQYRSGVRFMRVLKAIITCVFTYLVYSQILIALDQKEGLGHYFTPVFLLLIVGTTAYYLFESKNEK